MPQLLAIVDCDVMPASEARISVTDPGLLRADSVFEVIRLYDSHPFACDDHLDRLERSAAGLRLPLDRDTVRQKRPKRSSSGSSPFPRQEVAKLAAAFADRRFRYRQMNVGPEDGSRLGWRGLFQYVDRVRAARRESIRRSPAGRA